MNLDNLPVEWSVSQLTKMIASEGLISDGDWIESKDQDEKGDIRLIQLADIGDGDFRDKSNRYMNQDAFDRLNCVELKANDVLIARMPDPLGRACIFPKLPYKCVTVVDVCLIRTGERSAISPKLLKYWINSTQIRNLIALNATGTTRKRITRKKLESFDFPVPPLAEQQEIVRQLDLMLAQVEQIKARLDAIPAILKKFRQSVLADAVSGKLTEEWREVAEFDVDTWTYERAEDLCLKVQSGSTPRNNPFDQNGTIPFLKVYNIVDQKIAFDYKPQFILEDVHQNGSKRSICKPFDILMNIVGPPLGKVAIVTDQYPEWNINQAITMFRVDPEKLKYKFLYYILCEGQIVRDVLHETKGSVGQINISLSQCRDASIPKPSLVEQDVIVERVDSLLGIAEKIENTVQSAQKRVNLLTQSILAKAFSGELTAEWREQHQALITGVNSAESLLAKIQEEREASKPAKKTRKKKEV
ncbi:restriction endonuclease subunit S [Acinetobacter indicus]|uniref:restriction endonuclease subunit S n=1 Tax=Acinetobacter indicus TaxID=756892 RepID=UPI0034D3CBEE